MSSGAASSTALMLSCGGATFCEKSRCCRTGSTLHRLSVLRPPPPPCQEGTRPQSWPLGTPRRFQNASTQVVALIAARLARGLLVAQKHRAAQEVSSRRGGRDGILNPETREHVEQLHCQLRS